MSNHIASYNEVLQGFMAQVGTPPNYLAYIEQGIPKETVKQMIDEDIKRTTAKWIHRKSYGLNLTYKGMTDAGDIRISQLENQLFGLEQMPEPKTANPELLNSNLTTLGMALPIIAIGGYLVLRN